MSKPRPIGTRVIFVRGEPVTADLYLDEDALRDLIVKATRSIRSPQRSQDGPISVVLRASTLPQG